MAKKNQSSQQKASLYKSPSKEEVLQEVRNCAAILKNGGIILYPTDTVWGIGCDATNEEAVQKIYDLKKRTNAKSMICLVKNEAMLGALIKDVPEPAWDIVTHSTSPTTIIYDNPRNIASNLIALDNSLAIRVVSDFFCEYLIGNINKPIVSTSANLSNNATPKSFKEIDPIILKGVDYVVNLHREKTNNSASVIIKLANNGLVKIIRK